MTTTRYFNRSSQGDPSAGARASIPAALVLALFIIASAVLADGIAGPGAFDLSWNTVDGGGGTSTGGGPGGFELSGTIGQPDAGAPMTGGGAGGFELTGGFWPGAAAPAPTCPGDINTDGNVDVNDLLALIGAWGAIGANAADLNGDNNVNVNDLLILIGAWGACA